jgi:hypothetical protein
MMHIKYALKASTVHGIGLFADQEILTGQLIYTASPLLDVDITEAEFASLSAAEQHEVKYWGFFIPESKTWHVDFDVSKFINHSTTPTVTQDPSHSEAYLIAARDIHKGEELTQNYLEFESAEVLKRRGITV